MNTRRQLRPRELVPLASWENQGTISNARWIRRCDRRLWSL